MLSYIIAQSQSTKHLKLSDILKFSWDSDNKQNDTSTMTKEDVERLTKKMNEMIKDGRFSNET